MNIKLISSHDKLLKLTKFLVLKRQRTSASPLKYYNKKEKWLTANDLSLQHHWILIATLGISAFNLRQRDRSPIPLLFKNLSPWECPYIGDHKIRLDLMLKKKSNILLQTPGQQMNGSYFMVQRVMALKIKNLCLFTLPLRGYGDLLWY